MYHFCISVLIYTALSGTIIVSQWRCKLNDVNMSTSISFLTKTMKMELFSICDNDVRHASYKNKEYLLESLQSWRKQKKVWWHEFMRILGGLVVSGMGFKQCVWKTMSSQGNKKHAAGLPIIATAEQYLAKQAHTHIHINKMATPHNRKS